MSANDNKSHKNISGFNIRKYRLERNLSQWELAAKCQIEGVMLERLTISRIEAGTRIVADYELYVLAYILGVSMEELLKEPDSL